MKIENPFKLQNWKFKKFLIVVLFFQLSLLALFALDKMEIKLPIIQPLVGFVYLSFIPGYILLRILKLHKVGSIESFLYAIGLSLFVDMFVGFLMNMIYPTVGITNKPISEIPIILTMTGVVLLLCIIAYFRDKKYSNPDYIDLKDILNPQVLFLSLIPFMAIFGTYLVNYYHKNILLMIMIVVIALVALIIGFTNWIDKKYYPYAIWVMAVALIYHIVLIGDYIKIYDSQGYFPNLIMRLGIYVPTEYTGTYTTILTYSILIPMVLLMTKSSIVTTYKYIFPMYGSLIPLFIYIFVIRYLKSILSEKEAFFSAFLYMVLPAFFTFPAVVLVKQTLAIFLLAMFLNIMFNNHIENSKKYLLLIIVSITIIWTHYGTSILLFIMSIWSAILISLIPYLNKIKDYNIHNLIPKITLIYGILYVCWYMYVSQASVIEILCRLILSVKDAILYGAFDTTVSGGLVAVSTVYGPWNLTQKILFMFISFCAMLGVSYLFKQLFKEINTSIERAYSLMSLFWIVLFTMMFLPNMGIMGIGRTYLVAYAVIAPCAIIGFKYLSNIMKIWNIKIGYTTLTCYLLITTGFMNEITQMNPHSISLSQNSILKSNNIISKGDYYRKIVQATDINGAKWISKYSNTKKQIYNSGCLGLVEYAGVYPDGIILLTPDMGQINKSSYVCYGTINTKGIWAGIDKSQNKILFQNITNTKFYPVLRGHNRIYTNGGCKIYLS